MLLAGDVLKVAGDNPDVKKAGALAGKAVLTISKTVDNALLPLAAINFAFDKARDYFETKFPKDLEAKAHRIPPEQIVEPKASVAGPALQGLAFAHEERDLKNMYLELIAAAMDRRTAPNAHPAFVEMIRQMDAEEARFAQSVLKVADHAIVELRLQKSSVHGWMVLETHVIDFRDETSGAQLAVPRHAAMVDNWLRLGLVTVSYGTHLAGESMYLWAETRPETIRHRLEFPVEVGNVYVERGVLRRTALGEQFASVVGIIQPDLSSSSADA